jgi:hypothetical protein
MTTTTTATSTTAKALPPCRHCGERKANRPKQLCWRCHMGTVTSPSVRHLYPSTSKFARHGVRDTYATARRASEPTAAPPGSEAKVLVMIERAARREALFHPLDAPMNPEGASLDLFSLRRRVA